MNNRGLPRIKRFVNYSEFSLFASHLAHEKKRMGVEKFIEVYKDRHYTGYKARYLAALLETYGYKTGKPPYKGRLILDPLTYSMYFKYKRKDILLDSLRRGIPEFLKYGFLLEEIPRAVGDDA